MPTLTGTLHDVTGVELVPSMIRRLFVKAPAERASVDDPDTLIVSAPVDLARSGILSVALEPGPAVLVVDTYAGGPNTYELHVTADMTLLSEALAESMPDRSWVESVMVRLRAEAIAAAERAETAAGNVDAAIAGAADTVVQAVEQDRAAAEQARDDSVAAAGTAGDQATEATRQAGIAGVHAEAAGLSERNAKTSETEAGTSRQAAADHETAAKGFRDGALAARDESRDARDQADTLRNQAGQHATTATEKATEAGVQALAAADFTTTTRTYRDQAEVARDIAVANALTWRGTWQAGTAYAKQDAVSHSGSTWRAVVPSAGVTPVEGASWSLVAARGEPGQAGVTSIAWGDVQDVPDTFPPSAHTHGPETLGSGGTRSGNTFLNGLGNWVTPYTVMSQAEAETGTDTTSRVLSAARLREVIHHRVTGAAGTAVSLIGQALNRATTKAEARTVLGAVADDDARLSDARTPTTHKHSVGDFTATGTASSSTYLRGDGTWATPTNTTYSIPTQAEAEAGTATTARAFSAQRVRQAIDARAVTRQGSTQGLWIGTEASLPSTGTAGVLYVTY